ncbi:MAG TPA: hemagglutinin repeat-containing protein [Arsenophonus sp.]
MLRWCKRVVWLKHKVKTPSVGINLSYGSSAAKSTSRTVQQTVSGSNLKAGDNIRLTAIGKQDGSQGKLVIQASQLEAGKNITLLNR